MLWRVLILNFNSEPPVIATLGYDGEGKKDNALNQKALPACCTPP